MVTIKIDIPRSMYEAALTEEVQRSPHYMCLFCPFMGQTCSGPDPLELEGEELAKLAAKLMKANGMTRQAVADASNVPIGTIHNFLSGKTADIRTSTLRGIFSVILKNCKGKAPCHFASLLMRGELVESGGDDELQQVHAELLDARDELERLQHHIAHLEETLGKIHAFYKEELATVRAEEKEKITFLREQVTMKDGQITSLHDQIRRQGKTIDKLMGEDK